MHNILRSGNSDLCAALFLQLRFYFQFLLFTESCWYHFVGLLRYSSVRCNSSYVGGICE